MTQRTKRGGGDRKREDQTLRGDPVDPPDGEASTTPADAAQDAPEPEADAPAGGGAG